MCYVMTQLVGRCLFMFYGGISFLSFLIFFLFDFWCRWFPPQVVEYGKCVKWITKKMPLELILYPLASIRAFLFIFRWSSISYLIMGVSRPWNSQQCSVAVLTPSQSFFNLEFALFSVVPLPISLFLHSISAYVLIVCALWNSAPHKLYVCILISRPWIPWISTDD